LRPPRQHFEKKHLKCFHQAAADLEEIAELHWFQYVGGQVMPQVLKITPVVASSVPLDY
jgi:hypothetical protein